MPTNSVKAALAAPFRPSKARLRGRLAGCGLFLAANVFDLMSRWPQSGKPAGVHETVKVLLQVGVCWALLAAFVYLAWRLFCYREVLPARPSLPTYSPPRDLQLAPHIERN